MKTIKQKQFANGAVYALMTEDGFPVEVTDTFLPFYTKDAIGRKQNKLVDGDMGNRTERWMVGISCMSGCPVRCKFCATGKLRKWRCLTADEIVEQVEFVVKQNPTFNPREAKEFKINYTRMGEPFLNLLNVRAAICAIDAVYPNAHHYISTIGVAGSDFGWIKGNVTLQVSLHSLDEAKRDWLIPYRKKIPLTDLGKIRTESNLKTTLNLTLVDETDWNADKLAEIFDPAKFFVKISPINKNCVSDANNLGTGVIEGVNLL
jgi:23S rRNA (adenine2503-C2)-methyltransferase